MGPSVRGGGADLENRILYLGFLMSMTLRCGMMMMVECDDVDLLGPGGFSFIQNIVWC